MSIPSPRSQPTDYTNCVEIIHKHNSTLTTIATTITQAGTYSGIMSAYVTVLKEQHRPFSIEMRKIAKTYAAKIGSQKIEDLYGGHEKLVPLMRVYRETQSAKTLKPIIGYLLAIPNNVVLKEALHRSRHLVSCVCEKALVEIEHYLASVKRKGVKRFLPRIIAHRRQHANARLEAHITGTFEVLTPKKAKKNSHLSNVIPLDIVVCKQNFVSHLLRQQPDRLGKLIDDTDTWVATVSKPAERLAGPIFEEYVRAIIHELQSAASMADLILEKNAGLKTQKVPRSRSETSLHSSQLVQRRLNITSPQKSTVLFSNTLKDLVYNYLEHLERTSMLIGAAEGFVDSLKGLQPIVWAKINSFRSLIAGYRDKLFQSMKGILKAKPSQSQQEGTLWTPHREIVALASETLGNFPTKGDKALASMVRPIVVIDKELEFALIRLAGSKKLCLIADNNYSGLLSENKKVVVASDPSAIQKHPKAVACLLLGKQQALPSLSTSNNTPLMVYDLRADSFRRQQFELNAPAAISEIDKVSEWKGTLRESNQDISKWLTLANDLAPKLPKSPRQLTSSSDVRTYLSIWQRIVDQIALMNLASSNPSKAVGEYLEDLRVVKERVDAYTQEIVKALKLSPDSSSRQRRGTIS